LKADRNSLDSDNVGLRKDVDQERMINIQLNSEVSKLKALLAS